VAGDSFELVELAPGVTVDEITTRTGASLRLPLGVQPAPGITQLQ
jgi:3-oxoacid CoA-transferase subunit B